MFKKTLLVLSLCLAVSATAFAASVEKKEEGDKYKVSYPVFTLKNDKAAQRINDDILRVVTETKELAKSTDPVYVEVGTNYKIISENDKYINIIITSWDYLGGAHGMYYDLGIVYDAKSGKRVPYTKFAKKIKAANLYDGIANRKYKVFCSDLTTQSEAPFLSYIKKEAFNVSNHYILKDGKVYLMYPPYELDCYAVGTTYVELPKK
ncbi:MAG: PdaC/SigV domain-containing protein [Phascolarctobacterium sp.]